MLRNALSIATTPIKNTKIGERNLLTLFIFSVAAWYMIQRVLRPDSKRLANNIPEHARKFLLMAPPFKIKMLNKIQTDLIDVENTIVGLREEANKVRSQWPCIPTLPTQPTPITEILKSFDGIEKHYHRGKASGAVYAEYEPEIRDLLKTIYDRTNLTNPLHDHWPFLHKMKAEIIAWCQDLLHGSNTGHGIITHGGSTSIFEACFAYVRYAKEQGIDEPEILVPATAHPAFFKSAEILGVKIRAIPVDPATGKADVAAMRKAINRNTCMIVGSAPSYPQGIIDPIPEIAALAKEYNIPCHADSCLGGLKTACGKDAGFREVPYCDFSIPGVTSVSIDTHKFFEAPKGTSILCFHPDCPATPTQAYLDSVCGMYVTDSVDGSDSGARIATLWALLLARGKDYYVKNIGKILTLQRELVTALKNMPGLEVAFDPILSVVGFRPRKGCTIDPLLVAQKFEERGWSVNTVQLPDKSYSFHFCLTSMHTNVPNFVKDFVNDMGVAAEYAMANLNEKPKGKAKAYGKMPSAPAFVLKRIGEFYVRIQNTLPNVAIPGIWQQARVESAATPRRP